MIPQLLYHSSKPPLYPTNTASSLLAIRFPSPVRLASIRITPEGVQTVSGVGVTYPSRWKAKLLLNVSDAAPVNALTAAEIEYEDGGWERDYPVDMPDGVTTRLLMLLAPVERLTISVYGYGSGVRLALQDGTEGNAAGSTSSSSSTPFTVPTHEDWSWLFTPSTVPTLLSLLDDATPLPALTSALSSLLLISELRPILPLILDHPTALPFLLSQPSYPPQPLLQKMYKDPESALHRNLRYYLPHGHRMKELAQGGEDEMRGKAWDRMDEAGLRVLLELGPGGSDEVMQLQVQSGAGSEGGKSRLVSLVDAATTWADADDSAEERSAVCLGLALDVLDKIVDEQHLDKVIVGYLARAMPPLVVVANCRAQRQQEQRPPRTLSIPSSHARQILKKLSLVSTEIIHGQACYDAAMVLGAPYLQYITTTDPLYSFFTHPQPVEPLSLPYPNTIDGRRLARLDSSLGALTSTTIPSASGIQHQATLSELLAVVAPHLLASLSTARDPPLGIKALSTTPETQASSFAGKVYSEHEFRTRESSGSTLSVVGRVSRPASRHVDQY